MGTSKVYGSPKWPGVNRAVGKAVSSNRSSEQNITTALRSFASAYKSYLMSSTGGRGDGGHIGAGQRPSSGSGHGGGSGGVTRLRSAIGGARLAHFISTAEKSGLDEALREFNLSTLRDKPLCDLLDSIVEQLSSDGGLLDDDALNRAMAETLNELTEAINSIEEFDTLLISKNTCVEEVLQVYFSNFLAINFEQKEYSTVRKKITRENTNAFFCQARDIIRAIVRYELTPERDLTTVNWNSIDGQRLADEINQEVLDILMP